MNERFEIGRVYPRLLHGGAERGIVQLLSELDRTHMIVTHVDGLAAEEARRLAARYTLLGPGRFASLVEHLSHCRIAHLHTINDHLLAPLAARLAGCEVVVQTLENEVGGDGCALCDHSILVGEETRAVLDTPGRATVVPNGVVCPDLGAERPWFADGRPLRLIEVRREGKPMRFTLEELFATGALDRIEVEGHVVGVDGTARDPRITRHGALDDPYPLIAGADVLVAGSSTETFGRTVYEALACGTPAFATPLEPWLRELGKSDLVGFAPGGDAAVVAAGLVAFAEALAKDGRYDDVRARGHALVRDDYSVAEMARRTEAVYDAVATAGPGTKPAPSFVPEDVNAGELDALGRVVDAYFESRPPSPEDLRSLSQRASGVASWVAARTSGDPRQRSSALERAHGMLGPRAVVSHDLAVARLDCGDTEGALAACTEALALDPGRVSTHLMHVDLLARNFDLTGALEAARTLGERIPAYPDTDDLLALLERARPQRRAS